MAKKVYFCGSMRGGRQDGDLYMDIIRKIDSLGVQVLTEFVGWNDDSKLKIYGSEFSHSCGLLVGLGQQNAYKLHVGELGNRCQERGLKNDKDVHDDDVARLTESDAVIAEVTQPSLGVGYEIGRAVAMSKKILCLYRPQPDKLLSAMIRGAEMGEKFQVVDYKEEDVGDIINKFISSLN